MKRVVSTFLIAAAVLPAPAKALPNVFWIFGFHFPRREQASGLHDAGKGMGSAETMLGPHIGLALQADDINLDHAVRLPSVIPATAYFLPHSTPTRVCDVIPITLSR